MFEANYQKVRDAFPTTSVPVYEVALLYAAARQSGVQCLPLSEFVNSAEDFYFEKESRGVFPCSISQKWVARTYRKIVRLLDLDPTLLDVEACTVRLATKLGFNVDEEMKAVDIARRVKEQGLHVGRHPMSIAAGIAYCVSTRSTIQLSETTGLALVTIREAARRLDPSLKIFSHKCICGERFPRERMLVAHINGNPQWSPHHRTSQG